MTKTTNQTTTEPALSAPASRRLARWYRENGRHALPWRRTLDRYAILVSEVMLQQTQAARVVPYWLIWMEQWPDVPALAAASRADVIRAWSGLGYNNRAVRLHESARACLAKHDGRVPAAAHELRRLPGVGDYTAAAVRCFSSLPGPIPLDTNIGRVLARWEHGAAHLRDVPRSALAASAEAVALSGTPRDRALALMDLGALVCTARSPVCSSCPLRGECRWQQRGRPPGERRAVAAPKFETTARWARGRIVEMLRQQPHAEPALAAALPPAHAQRLGEYLAALHGDGLIEQDGAAWRLVGDQAMNIASPKL